MIQFVKEHASGVPRNAGVCTPLMERSDFHRKKEVKSRAMNKEGKAVADDGDDLHTAVEPGSLRNRRAMPRRVMATRGISEPHNSQ